MGAMNDFSAVIELRRYKMRPGGRDELVALFEREFIETQEAVGLQILGIFREPMRPSASPGCAALTTCRRARRA